ncbi:MAG TPA: hypothetical protein VGE19_03535 [Pseudoxanthomonas sp.]|jgi:hypothetical protein
MKLISLSAALFSAALFCVPVRAQTQAQTLTVPGTMTQAGHTFARQCSDAAFANHPDPAALAQRCERLLARWQQQANRRIAHRANPRVEAVYAATADQANLPYDTTAFYRQAPLVHSYGGR